MFAQTKRLKKFFGYFFLFDFALANGCREADKKRGNRPPRRRKNALFFFCIKFFQNIAKPRFCLQNGVVRRQACFVGAPLNDIHSQNKTRGGFLLGYFLKEKVDKRGAVDIACGTNFKYQDFLAAFL